MRGSLLSRVGVGIGVMLAVASSVQARPAAKLPTAVLATVERGPASARDGITDFANAIKPGTGIALTDGVISMLMAKAVGVSTIGGLDPAQPQYLVWVDDGAVHGAVLVGAISDDAMLTTETERVTVVRDHGHAVIGAKPVVDLISAWALGALDKPGLGRPSATIYVGNVLRRYHADLAKVRSQLTVGGLLGGQGATAGFQSAMMGMASIMFDGVMSIAADTDRVILTVDGDSASASIDVSLVPRAGSRLAKFVAAQQPSDFAMLNKLPAGAAAAIAVGAFHGGPYRNAVATAMAAVYAGGDAKAMLRPTLDLMQASSGEFAVMNRMTSTGMLNLQVMGLSAPAGATEAYADMLVAMATPLSMTVMGMKATLHANPHPLVYDGLAIGSFDTAVDQTSLTKAQLAALSKTMPGGRSTTYAGVVDRLGVTVSGSGDGEAMAKALVDTARGHSPGVALSVDQVALVASARSRHDSAMMLVDMNLIRGIVAPPGTTLPVLTMMVSSGFADHRAHVRMTMPVATFKNTARMP